MKPGNNEWEKKKAFEIRTAKGGARRNRFVEKSTGIRAYSIDGEERCNGGASGSTRPLAAAVRLEERENTSPAAMPMADGPRMFSPVRRHADSRPADRNLKPPGLWRVPFFCVLFFHFFLYLRFSLARCFRRVASDGRDPPRLFFGLSWVAEIEFRFSLSLSCFLSSLGSFSGSLPVG